MVVAGLLFVAENSLHDCCCHLLDHPNVPAVVAAAAAAVVEIFHEEVEALALHVDGIDPVEGLDAAVAVVSDLRESPVAD